MCKCSHFIRHYREAAPLLTCTGSLYCGIQRQQIGLVGDITDNIKDGIYFFTAGFYIPYHITHGSNICCQCINGVNGILYNPMTNLCLFISFLRHLCRAGCTARYLLGRRSHLVHGCSDLGSFATLAVRKFQRMVTDIKQV